MKTLFVATLLVVALFVVGCAVMDGFTGQPAPEAPVVSEMPAPPPDTASAE